MANKNNSPFITTGERVSQLHRLGVCHLDSRAFFRLLLFPRAQSASRRTGSRKGLGNQEDQSSKCRRRRRRPQPRRRRRRSRNRRRRPSSSSSRSPSSRLNVPKTTSNNSSTTSSENKYVAPKSGSSQGVPPDKAQRRPHRPLRRLLRERRSPRARRRIKTRPSYSRRSRNIRTAPANKA